MNWAYVQQKARKRAWHLVGLVGFLCILSDSPLFEMYLYDYYYYYLFISLGLKSFLKFYILRM